MKVSASNLENKYSNAQILKNSSVDKKVVSAPSFSGKTKASMELARDLVQYTPRFPRFLQWLGKNDGEILNTIVTGVGTAFVAPVFIAFNPFSKEDKETRTYSAWRQPISAVLAAIMQIGVNMKYNAHLEKMASTGHFDRADLKDCPTVGYLSKLIRYQHPEYSKKELEIAIENEQIRARWDAVDRERSRMRNTEIKPEQMIDDEVRRIAKDEVKAEFKSEIDGIKGKKAKEKFIDKKVNERVNSVATRLVEEKADIKYEVRKWIEKARSANLSYDDLVKAKTAEVEVLRIVAEKTPEQVKQLELWDKVLKKLKNYGSYESVKKIGTTREAILQNIKIKQYVYAKIDNANIVLKNYKRQTGIVISLLTLPISCGLLNWVYPRLMEKIMPEASKKKKAKQAAELQSAAVSAKGKEVK